MSFSLGEYQDIFLEEADEMLQELNKNMLELENNPENLDIINNIFRAAHSLKSSAAFVGLNDLRDLAHKLENLFQGIRDETNSVTGDVIDIIFKSFDAINDIIEDVAAGNEPDTKVDGLIEKINVIHKTSLVPGSGGLPEDETPPENKENEETKSAPKSSKMSLSSFERDKIFEAFSDEKHCFIINVAIEKTAQMKWVKGQLISVNLENEGDVLKMVPSIDDMSADEGLSAFSSVFITSLPTPEIIKLCDVDQVEDVEIREIVAAEKDGKPSLKMMPPKRLSDERKSSPADNEKAEQQNSGNLSQEGNGGDTLKGGAPSGNDQGTGASDGEELKKHSAGGSNTKRKTTVSKTVKVSVEKLDLLLNNVGELVIANSGFFRIYEEIRKYNQYHNLAGEFKNRMEQMSRIAKDLQAGIMTTRMLPIGQVFSRFSRLVRDLAKEHNKNVELVLMGEETELDTKVIDLIGEPLLHLIRNAVDHGIEPVEERLALGKPEKSKVVLNAYQGGDHIFVEISDDGRGLDVEAIKKKVIEKNLESPEVLDSMDDQQIYNYIFHPGLSTAKKVTDISGRGVGMNVVMETVTELNGNVIIKTEKGQGTKFVMSFPLTLAIIQAIMVKVREEFYAIPLSDVIETIKISVGEISTIEDNEVINLRGEILSLLRLHEFVGLAGSLGGDDEIPVVVVSYGNRKIGLIVDSLEGKMEIVIKSLEQNYVNVNGISGASILGDGSICLILDIQTMIGSIIELQEKLSDDERKKLMMMRHGDLYSSQYDKPQSQEEHSSPDVVELEELPSTEDLVETEEPDLAQDALEDEDSSSDVESISPREQFEDTSLETPAVSSVDSQAAEESNDLSDVLHLDNSSHDKDKEEQFKHTPAESIFDLLIDPDSGKNDSVLSGTGKGAGIDSSVSESEDKEPLPRSDEEIDEEVKGALEDFKDELKANISSVVDSGASDAHVNSELGITQEEINQFNLVSNIGVAIAAESLSRILGKRIDLSIPEVKISPIENIPGLLGDLNDVYFGVLLDMEGDVEGTLLFALKESVGLKLIGLLYGDDGEKRSELDEDGISALKELTNILGASVINVYAEKGNLMVKPDVPIFGHDFLQSLIDSVLVVQSMSSEYAIVMETAFFFEDDEIMGTLMVLPKAESMKVLVNAMMKNDSQE